MPSCASATNPTIFASIQIPRAFYLSRAFRNEGAFHEAITDQILDDLVAATQPTWMRIEGDFLIRGGIRTVVNVERARKTRMKAVIALGGSDLGDRLAHLNTGLEALHTLGEVKASMTMETPDESRGPAYLDTVVN